MVKPVAGYRPLAYSSPEPVQTTGTVADRLDGTLADHRGRDSRRDAVTGHIGDLRIENLGLLGASASEIAAFQPLAGDPLQLAEQIDFRFLARVAEFAEQ